MANGSPISSESVGVGQQGSVNDFTQKYDSSRGLYKDTVDVPVPDDRLPTVSMPKGPDPAPFSIGPMAPGGRE